MGVIAHELQEHFPFLVNGSKDDASFQSVNYTGLVALLVKELQVMKSKLTSIEENIDNKLSELESDSDSDDKL
jgi:hypothetical protein